METRERQTSCRLCEVVGASRSARRRLVDHGDMARDDNDGTVMLDPKHSHRSIHGVEMDSGRLESAHLEEERLRLWAGQPRPERRVNRRRECKATRKSLQIAGALRMIHGTNFMIQGQRGELDESEGGERM